MATLSFEAVLDQCITDLTSGARTLEECLEEYPEFRQELEPLLRIGLNLSAPDVVLSQSRKAQARYAFVEALHQEAEVQQNRRGWWPFPIRGLSSRAAVPAALALAVALTAATGSGAAFASQDALPGDPLYGVKTTLEQMQVALAANDEARTQLQLSIAETRLDELLRALALNDSTAALKAAEGYSVVVNEVSQRVETLEASGRDVQTVRDSLETGLARQQERLESVPATVSPIALEAVDTARKKIKPSPSLTRATARTPNDREATRDEGKGAAPVAAITAPAAVPPIEPTSANQVIGPVSESGPSDRHGPNAAAAEDTPGGLKARLDTASTMAARGQDQPALNVLKEFMTQLDALRRSGRISAGEYSQLESEYKVVLASLEDKDTSGPSKDEPYKDQGRGHSDDAALPSAAVSPSRGEDRPKDNDQNRETSPPGTQGGERKAEESGDGSRGKSESRAGGRSDSDQRRDSDSRTENNDNEDDGSQPRNQTDREDEGKTQDKEKDEGNRGHSQADGSSDEDKNSSAPDQGNRGRGKSDDGNDARKDDKSGSEDKKGEDGRR